MRLPPERLLRRLADTALPALEVFELDLLSVAAVPPDLGRLLDAVGALLGAVGGTVRRVLLGLRTGPTGQADVLRFVHGLPDRFPAVRLLSPDSLFVFKSDAGVDYFGADVVHRT